LRRPRKRDGHARTKATTLNFSLREAALSLDVLVVTGTAADRARKKWATRWRRSTQRRSRCSPSGTHRTSSPDARRASPSCKILGSPERAERSSCAAPHSITQGTNPIIYVDGVRIYSDNGPITAGARQSSLFANDIKADDIERLEIVKGAAATTLYGTEASGGVIQIFTKKGSAGSPRWSLDLAGGQNFMGHVGPKSDPTGLFVN
jgi:TonB-dependent SusC/RagA subfamily outer membrane receptor